MGGTVQLTRGTFPARGFIDPKNNITIQGEGQRATTISFVALQKDIGFFAGDEGIAARSGFVVRDMKLEGNGGSVDFNDNTDMLHFTDCTNYRIENIVAQNSAANALYIVGPLTSGVIIRNFYATGCSRSGIEIAEGAHIEGDFITCISNSVTGNGQEINIEAGAARTISDVKLSHIYAVAYNQASNRACLAINSDAQLITDLIISDFLLVGGVNSVSIRGPGRAKLSHGVIRGGTNGISFSEAVASFNVSVVDVDIYDCETRGIYVAGPAATATKNLKFMGVNIDGTADTYAAATSWGVVVATAPLNNVNAAYLIGCHIHDCTNNITDADGKVAVIAGG